jgi:hypothetical protein
MLKGGIDYMSEDGKENKEKTIFFAKAIQDGSKFGTLWTEKVIDNFSDSSIIDISEVEKQIKEDEKNLSYKIYGSEWRSWEDLYESEKKYFFRLIDECDFVVSAEAWNHPRRGKYTAKVIVEMEYALSIGKKVLGINIEDWKFKEITKEDLVKIRKEKEDEITFLKFLLRSL